MRAANDNVPRDVDGLQTVGLCLLAAVGLLLIGLGLATGLSVLR